MLIDVSARAILILGGMNLMWLYRHTPGWDSTAIYMYLLFGNERRGQAAAVLLVPTKTNFQNRFLIETVQKTVSETVCWQKTVSETGF